MSQIIESHNIKH